MLILFKFNIYNNINIVIITTIIIINIYDDYYIILTIITSITSLTAKSYSLQNTLMSTFRISYFPTISDALY